MSFILGMIIRTLAIIIGLLIAFLVISGEIEYRHYAINLCNNSNLSYNAASHECYKITNNQYYAIPIIQLNNSYYLDMNRARVK